MINESKILIEYKKFKKEDSNKKRVGIGNKLYVELKKLKTKDIRTALFFRSADVKKFFEKELLQIGKIDFYYTKTKNLKIKNLDELNKNLKKIIEQINILKYGTFKDKNEIKKIDEYKDEFFKNLKKRKIKKETIKRYERQFIKRIIPFFKNKSLETITKEDLVDYCNFVLENLEYRGAAVSRGKQGCPALQESISLIRLFYRFLLSQDIIKEETINVIENFNYKKYFDFCQKQGKSVALQHFKDLSEAREFYRFLQELKEEIEKWFENEDEVDKEYLAKLLGYKNKKLLNTHRLSSFLHKILITEFIMLTSIRGTDFFKIKEDSIKFEENNIKYIYFEATKNNEEYTLYLTDYLFELYMQILNTKGDCYRAKERKKYLTCLTHQSFRNFMNEFFVNHHKININIHGFRHTMKTLVEEYLSFSRAVVESQLGHKYEGMDSHYLQSDLKLKRLELLEKYRTLLSNQEYAFMYDRKDTLKREIFKFLEEMNVKYSANFNEIIQLLIEIKQGDIENNVKTVDSENKIDEKFKKIIDSFFN